MKAAQGSNAQGRARRAEYIRLRAEGIDAVSAAGQLDLTLETRCRYERWFEALHPDRAAPRDKSVAWWRFRDAT